MNTEPTRKYAVLFRVHFWNDYVERQYKRLCSVVGRGDVFILVDETNGTVPVPHSNVVSHTQDELLALGLSGSAGHGGMLWFNGDYPLYAFYKHHGKYDYYIMTEYDVVAQRRLEKIIQEMTEDKLDFVGLTKGEAVADWTLTSTCQGVYPEEQIQKRLICIAFFSNRAIRHLFKRRLEMSHQKKEGALQGWPHCEAFIPTEIANAGLRMAELDRFGSTVQYDWRPALLEADLAGLAQNGFIHPVLDSNHFAQHAVKNLSLRSIRNITILKRVPVKTYARPLARKLLGLIWSSVRKRIRQPLKK